MKQIPLDARPDGDEIRAWLGPALNELTDDQLARLVQIWDECRELNDDESSDRLSAAVQYMIGTTDTTDAGLRLLHARQNLESAKIHARQVAMMAAKDGVPETEIAQALGVDRAKTLRRWLGK